MINKDNLQTKKPPDWVALLFGGDGGNRTRVRKFSAFGSTCLADSFNLTACDPNGRARIQRFR